MKLPNCTKKRETRATLYTFKIMSLIKREMKLQNNRLGKIGDHISATRRIKLREYRRNIKQLQTWKQIHTNALYIDKQERQRDVWKEQNKGRGRKM
jgi:hypothetical protein